MTLLKESAERVKDELEDYKLDYSVKDIIRNNLDIMRSSEKGGMEKLIQGESMAGNAGTESGYPCFGANFFYDKKGEIKYFGNHGEKVPREFRNLPKGTFKILLDLKNGIERIVDIFNMDKKEVLLLTASHHNRIFNVW